MNIDNLQWFQNSYYNYWRYIPGYSKTEEHTNLCLKISPQSILTYLKNGKGRGDNIFLQEHNWESFK
jgi:hypothetical protein